jgi:hypothetical protein
MFAFPDVVEDTHAGGLHVEMPGVGGTPWRRNWIVRDNWRNMDFDHMPANDVVYGGIFDGLPEIYCINGNLNYTSRVLLSPINLMVPELANDAIRHYHVATVPGAAYADMKNVEVGAEITFGSETWKVFPAFRKNLIDADNGSFDGSYYSYGVEDNSGPIGIAWRK